MKCEICGNEYGQLRNHIRRTHGMDPVDYYAKYILKGPIPKCANPNCDNEVRVFYADSITNGLAKYCCKECSKADASARITKLHEAGCYSDHSEKLRELHRQGVYKGTSYLTQYNKDWKYKYFSGAMARSDMNRAYSSNPGPISKFYILKMTDSIKIGILTSSETIENYSLRRGYNEYGSLDIYEGPSTKVIELEYLLKSKKRYQLQNYWIVNSHSPEIDFGWTETYILSFYDHLITLLSRLSWLRKL